MRQIKNTGSRLRFLLRIEAIGVCLQDVRAAPLWLDGIFIDIALFDIRDESGPDLAVLQALQWMHARIPGVEIAHDTHGLRMRRPNGKAYTLPALLRHKVCAQHFVGAVVRSLMEQI